MHGEPRDTECNACKPITIVGSGGWEVRGTDWGGRRTGGTGEWTGGRNDRWCGRSDMRCSRSDMRCGRSDSHTHTHSSNKWLDASWFPPMNNVRKGATFSPE